jgi:hypothetical protein
MDPAEFSPREDRVFASTVERKRLLHAASLVCS